MSVFDNIRNPGPFGEIARTNFEIYVRQEGSDDPQEIVDCLTSFDLYAELDPLGALEAGMELACSAADTRNAELEEPLITQWLSVFEKVAALNPDRAKSLITRMDFVIHGTPQLRHESRTILRNYTAHVPNMHYREWFWKYGQPPVLNP